MLPVSAAFLWRVAHGDGGMCRIMEFARKAHVRWRSSYWTAVSLVPVGKSRSSILTTQGAANSATKESSR
mgnify:CR=1 FL=1